MADESLPPGGGASAGPSRGRSKPLRDSKGWDGKLRVNRSGEASDGGDAPSESETENQDVQVPGQQIEPDDGKLSLRPTRGVQQTDRSDDRCEQTCWMTIRWTLPYVLCVLGVRCRLLD